MPAAGLSALLGLLERTREPTMHASSWEERIGAPIVASLLRLGILVEQGQADWYPCGGPHGEGCPRRVVPNLGDQTHPFVAVCGQGNGACESVPLVEADLRLLAASYDGLVAQLRKAFGLSGVVDAEEAGFPESRRIGASAARATFLALCPGMSGFEAWLAARGNALVLVPAGNWVPSAVRDRFGPGQPVELVVLGEVLDLVDGRLVVKWRAPANLMLHDGAAPSYVVREATVCVVHDRDGRRELTTREYEELAAQAETYDLFVDMTAVVKGGGYRGGRRCPGGKFEDIVLTKHEAAAVVELATAGTALRAGDFKAVTVNDVERLVERARKKLDVRVSRYEWRAIHTLPADLPEAKRWQFKPRIETRWSIVCCGVG